MISSVKKADLLARRISSFPPGQYRYGIFLNKTHLVTLSVFLLKLISVL